MKYIEKKTNKRHFQPDDQSSPSHWVSTARSCGSISCVAAAGAAAAAGVAAAAGAAAGVAAVGFSGMVAPTASLNFLMFSSSCGAP